MPILSSERVVHKDYNRKCSVEKNVGRESQRLVAKTNWLAVNRQAVSNSDSNFDWEGGALMLILHWMDGISPSSVM
jgi:hypothetical protein